METLFNDIKGLLLDEGNKRFAKHGAQKVNERGIVFGVIDSARNSEDVIIAVTPETLEVADEMLGGGYSERGSVCLTIAIKGKPYNTLMHLMCVYAESIRELFMDCDGAQVGETRYFPDCGTAPMSMTGAEIDLTIENRRGGNAAAVLPSLRECLLG